MAATATETQSRLVPSLGMITSYLMGTSSTDLPGTNDSKDIEPAEILRPSTPLTRPSSPQRPALTKTARSRSLLGEPDCPPSPSKSVMFRDAETRSYMSDEQDSREGSFDGSNAGESKKRRRSTRPKTSYSLCHPPPKSSTRHKIQVRPKPLMQLHKLAPPSRPMPAYEVLPSAIFSASLSRAIAKICGAKHGLCSNDIAIVNADIYHGHEASGADEDEARDVMALICKGRKGDSVPLGRARIYLDDGSEWEAYPLPNGGYEFTKMDVHGLSTTVRWVQKKTRSKDSPSTPESEAPAARIVEKRFNFSTISPNSRRHPVIANLASTSLDISDSYNMPAPASTLAASSMPPPMSRASSSNDLLSDAIITTDELRTLITATAVWVALREGWSPSFRYDDTCARSPSMKSITQAKPGMSPPGSPSFRPVTIDLEPVRRSSSLRQMLRPASIMKRQNTKSSIATVTTLADAAYTSGAAPPTAATAAVTRRARADTTSTVLIHRSASQWRPETPRSHTDPEVQRAVAINDDDRDHVLSQAEHDFDSEDEDTTIAELEAEPEQQQAPRSGAASPAAPHARAAAASSRLRPVPPSQQVRISSTSTTSDIETRKADAKREMLKMRQGQGRKRSGLRALLCGLV